MADEQHSLDYSPGKKIRVWGHQDAPNHLREELMYQVTAPTKEGKGWAIWTSGVITVEGRSLLRFYNNSNTAKTRGSETIWVDPDTLRVVRSERRQYNIPNDATYMEVRDHFRYNETLPANIFAPLTEHR